MNARSNIARLAAALASLLMFLPIQLFAAGTESSRRAHDLQLSVDSRWAGGANGGYYPIRIRLVNLARPRALEFVFTDMGGNDSREPTVTRQVFIDQNAQQNFTLPIPLVSRGTYGQLRVFENGRELDQLSQQIALPDAQQGWADRPSLLVISPTPASVNCTQFELAVETLTATGGGGRAGWGPYGAYSVRTNDYQVIPPLMLPESWIDYSALDIVAIPLERLDKIPTEARSALLKWVSAGGTLIVYEVGKPADQSADLTRLLELTGRPTPFQTWHPADPVLQTPLVIATDGSIPGMPGGMSMMPTPGAPVTVEVTTPVDAQGNPVVNANKPLWPVSKEAFSRVDYLAGQVFAFPGNPFPGAAIDWGWWLKSAKLENLKFTSRNGLSSRQMHPDFFNYLIPGVGAIPVIAFIVLITLFAVLIGPINYFVVWRRRQLYLLVLTIPAIAFLTSSALFGYAMIADGFGVQSRLRSFTVLDQRSKTAVAFSRISLYAGIVPSAGLTFSPDTAVLPVWPDHGCLDSGNVDWTNKQHLARGWLRSRTPAQFQTISVRAERGRIDVRPSGEGTVEVANGLEWDVALLVVKDDAGRLYAAHKVPAGATARAATATPEDLKQLSGALDVDQLKAPPGADPSNSYSPFDRNSRRAMMYGYYGQQQENSASFARSAMEANFRLLTRPAQDPVAGGMPPQTYLAVFSKNPDIELGVEKTRPAAGLQVLLGYY
jgi:hypothetical protein